MTIALLILAAISLFIAGAQVGAHVARKQLAAPATLAQGLSANMEVPVDAPPQATCPVCGQAVPVLQARKTSGPTVVSRPHMIFEGPITTNELGFITNQQVECLNPNCPCRNPKMFAVLP
jgi:hypothetical protein